MKSNFRRFVAVMAASMMLTMQMPGVSVSAKDKKNETTPVETTAAAAETTAAAASTTAAASTSAAKESTTAAASTTAAKESTTAAASTTAAKESTTAAALTTAAEESTTAAASTTAAKETTTAKATATTTTAKETAATTTAKETTGTTETTTTTAATETTSTETTATTPAETEPTSAFPVKPDFHKLGAVGTLTEGQTFIVAESIYNALCNHEIKVVFDMGDEPKLLLDDIPSVQLVQNTVLYSCREGILCRRDFGFTKVMTDPITIKAIKLNYTVPDDFGMYQDEYTRLSDEIDNILDKVDPAWSAPEKALFLHDYMAVNYNYDNESYARNRASGGADANSPCFTAYGMLTEGSAVCDGYAWLYNILLNECGIESYKVSSEENGHAWNLLCIDGKYYNVDVTWDDNRQLADSNVGLAGQVNHENFLKGIENMRTSGHKYEMKDWVISTGVSVFDLPVGNTYNHCFWNNTKAAIYPFEGGWLVKEPDPFNRNAAAYNLYRYDSDSNDGEWIKQIATEANPWYANLDKTQAYSDNYSVPYVEGDVLYYTTNSNVMAVTRRVGGGEYEYVWTWLFNLDQEEMQDGYIYGLRIVDDTMYYHVAPGYLTKEAKVYTKDVTEFRERITANAGGTLTFAGDYDGDQQLGVTDIVGMSRYLAGVDTVESPEIRKNLDVVEDGVLDVFDLAKMKWMLINS